MRPISRARACSREHALGKVLEYERISVIEFGVAGGRGLLAMERAAELIETMVRYGDRRLRV